MEGGGRGKPKKSSTWEWHQYDCFFKISKGLRGVERGLKSVGADDDGDIISYLIFIFFKQNQILYVWNPF